jgi:hypothetical protein
MSLDTRTAVLNGLAPKYAEIFGEKYSNLYREHIGESTIIPGDTGEASFADVEDDRESVRGRTAGRRLAHDMTIEEYRDSPVLLSFGCEGGPDVEKTEEVHIPVEDGSEITLRIYYPPGYERGNSGLLPCYFNVHGGGWVIGDLGDDDSFLRTVCVECNAIIVDVGYRLAPEYKYPIPVTDCWDAFKWTVKNGEKYGIDKTKIAVGGFSAGGHISAVISQLARDQDFEAKPCFQLLVIPVCDATALDTSLNVRKGEHRLVLIDPFIPVLTL